MDLDSDLTDSSDDGQPDEVLIAAHDIMDEAAAPLPGPLLKTIIKPAGQMLVFGLLDFDATGRRNSKGLQIQPDLILTSPHRFFPDLKVFRLPTVKLSNLRNVNGLDTASCEWLRVAAHGSSDGGGQGDDFWPQRTWPARAEQHHHHNQAGFSSDTSRFQHHRRSLWKKPHSVFN